MLAIHWRIEFFRPYLFRRKFIVVTDHRSLISLFTHKNQSSKLTRVRVELCDYDFEIIYKQGKMNTNADALSRIKLNSDMLKDMIPIENDSNAKPRILAITRGMKAKEISEESKEKDISQAQQKHHIWECSSLQDIKNIREIKFNIYKTGIKNKDGPRDGTLENINNSYVMNLNENLAKYVLLLE